MNMLNAELFQPNILFTKELTENPKERQQSWQGNTGKNDKSNPEAKAKDERVESEVNETNKGINIDIKV